MEEHKEEVITKLRNSNAGWKYLFVDDSIWEKIGEERLLRFAEQCLDLRWDVKAKTHQLDDEVKESEYQKEFLSIMGEVYGDHAVEILKDRPNLTLGNIPNVRVFHPTIYENFGAGFINFMININYGAVTDVLSFDSIIESIISNPEDMEAFKFCKTVVESNAKESVYNYNTLFRTYSRYSDLMKDCCETLKKDPNALTQGRYQVIKDIIVSENSERVLTLEDVDAYTGRSRERYNAEIADATKPSDVKKIILSRYFGLTFSANSKEFFNRNTKNAKKLIESYGVGKIVKYEEMLASEGKPTHLDQSELKILKIMYAVTMYGGETPEETVRVLKDMYKVLDENAEQVIRPADVNSILAKIPEIYAEEINSRVTSIADLERKLEAGEKGISKHYHTVVRDGVEHQIPIITLKGAKYGFYASTLNANLSGYHSSKDFAHTWFEYENGVSHISASLVTHDSRKSAIEFKAQNSDYFTVIIPKNDEIIAMGSDDIFSPSKERVAEIYSEESDGFKFADEVIADTGSGGYDYNEFVFNRYNLKSDRFSNKEVPEGIIRNGTELSEKVLNGALDFKQYMDKYEISNKDPIKKTKEFPIVLVDKSAYLTINNELNHIRTVSNAQKFKEMQITEEEVSEIATSFVAQPTDGSTSNIEDRGLGETD